MSFETVIEFIGVNKIYKIGALNSITRFINRKHGKEDFCALRNISFTVKKGSVFGIIGANGAGKSTILKLLAGVTVPDSGEIKILGRIAPLLELGAGFHPELSGRENIYINGALLGLTKDEVDSRFDEIVAFSELSEFIDTPVKKYSSGMFVRLGFAIAVHTDPDILLVDEVLAVGDEKFQRKCLLKINQFRTAGKTIVFVSHDIGMVSNICTDVMLLANGQILESGSVDGTVGQYLQLMGEGEGTGIIRSEELTLLFNSGRGGLFWNGKEITKKYGLYTSVLVNSADSSTTAVWQDSTRAVWKCDSFDESTLLCRGEYISVPLVQEWKFQFVGRILHWHVLLEVLKPLTVERRQANVMLSENYLSWKTEDAIGYFPADFTSRDYHNWDILTTSEESTLTAQKSGALPSITFSSVNHGYIGCIVNSNFYFSGRVLMSLALENMMLQPGRYEYFSGMVQLDE